MSTCDLQTNIGIEVLLRGGGVNDKKVTGNVDAHERRIGHRTPCSV